MHKPKSYCRHGLHKGKLPEEPPRIVCRYTVIKDVIASSEIGAFQVLPQRYTTLAKSRLITHVTRGQVSLVKLPYSNFYSSQALLRPGFKNMFRNMDDRQFLSPDFLELDKILNMKKLHEEIGCSSTLIIQVDFLLQNTDLGCVNRHLPPQTRAIICCIATSGRDLKGKNRPQLCLHGLLAVRFRCFSPGHRRPKSKLYQ